MAGIGTYIKLNDQMSATLERITEATNRAEASWHNLDKATSGGLVANGMDAISARLDQINSSIVQVIQNQQTHTEEVQKTTTATDGLLTKVGALVGAYVSVRSIVNTVRESMDLFNTQLNAQTQLATTLANMVGDEWESAYDRILKKSTEIQKKGIYGDEAMIGAGAEFATYMTDTAAIEKMMDTLANYAVGMSGGGALGYEELVNYATNLGKITTGAYDAMTKKGFEFSDAQKAVIDGSATEEEYLETLGEGWRDMSDDMRSATVIADIINEAWGGMYDTMSNTPQGKIIQMQNAWGDLKETIGEQLYPVVVGIVDTINANWSTITTVIEGLVNGIGAVITVLGQVISAVFRIGQVAINNWSTIGPIIASAIAVLTAYKAVQMAVNAVQMASPITFILAAIIAIIAAIVIACQRIAEITGVAESAFGVIAGGISWIGALFKNLGLTVANFGIGIWEAIGAVCSNIGTAFHNVIANVQGWWYGMLATVLDVVAGIAEALNKIPFISFDYSGLTAKADEYAKKSAEAYGSTEEYQSISEAFNNGMNTFDTFGEGWGADAFQSGVKWGDGVSRKVGDLFGGLTDTGINFDGLGLDSLVGNTEDIADYTGETAKTLNIANEDLKYMRDIAERDTINRFTTAEVKVEMGGVNNTVNQNTDLDGVISYLASNVADALEVVREGAAYA